ncbi:MAG: site-specific integrase [Desulfomonile tiedjei]|uniref:Site-specific integrase n=1 Tax=Desulfomonile tiedjei TaxID=2358 RepID=A0A9D6V7Y2_9BACT|nr:site-specific integrase [Desulfomonile tiedjei]
MRCTKATNKKEAQEICRTWEKAAREAETGKLTPERAREIISQGVSSVFLANNQEAMPNSSIENWCNQWLESKGIESKTATHARYKSVIVSFIQFLGKGAKRDLATLSPAEVMRFRDHTAKKLTKASANVSLKILRACFAAALRHGIITTNPAVTVSILKKTDEAVRRALTITEIKAILVKCKDSEWEGLVMMGLYSGQRLGDLAKLRWDAIDLQKGELALVTQKTQRRMILPLATPLLNYLLTLKAPGDPNAYVFPELAAVSRVSTLSNQFHNILVQAGLTPARTHEKQKAGRSTKRETNPVSFHSLRHSAVTFLKAAGVTDALAREIIGHESAAISRAYTHLNTEDIRPSINKLPDVSKKEEKPK